MADLLLNKSALDMAMNAADGIWRHRRHGAGTSTTELNRNIALRGTGYGWHTQQNAVRSVLLLAAMARVAGPLLGPLAGSEPEGGQAPSGAPASA